MEEQKQFVASQLLNAMVDLTLTRHTNMSSEDFVKELGFEGETEDKVVRKAKFALLNAISKEIIMANDKVRLIDATLKAIFEDKGE